MAEPSYEELKAKLAQLEKEVEVKKRSGDLIFKVGEKGGVSVYGPVSYTHLTLPTTPYV